MAKRGGQELAPDVTHYFCVYPTGATEELRRRSRDHQLAKKLRAVYGEEEEEEKYRVKKK